MTDMSELGQSLKRRAASANEFGESLYVKADDVLALVEALEKAQSRDVIQSAKDYHFDQQADRIAELDAELEREREKSRRVMSRIAELESRTVKLPAERFCPAEYAGSQLWSETEVWNKAITACADELRASGIKVEAE
ncbi:hypothetical protein Q8G17_20010 [Klebsiella pneumoniae]|nr:hypothetical protein [Klebsiella pneumoniae]MDP0616588.1 hypothetical protein [Klebsiella pneumoniae]